MSETFDSTIRLGPTFMDGAILAAGAIPDTVLIYSGGACITEYFNSNFRLADWSQDLVRADPATTRLVLTFSDLTAGVMGTTDAIIRVAEAASSVKRPAAFLLAELSRFTIAGEDLEVAAKALRDGLRIPTIPLTRRLLARDYRAAYSAALEGVARIVPDEAFEGGPEEDLVAVIGYLFERNEMDQHANVAAMEGLLRRIGLRVAPTWFSHRPLKDLFEAARASVLLALPLGRKAARQIAERSGAMVIDVDLPVGVGATEEFLIKVGEATSRVKAAKEVVVEEAARVAKRLEVPVLKHLAGRRVAAALLPDWIPGMRRMLSEDLGLDVAFILSRARSRDTDDLDGQASQDPERDHDPSVLTWNHHIDGAREEGGLDLIVGSTWERNALEVRHRAIPFLEFGFPCMGWHDLLGFPALGFEAPITFAQRVLDRLSCSMG